MFGVKFCILFFALALFPWPFIFAQQAVIRDLSGTVELKLPGSQTWTNARAGHALAGDTVISTGFRSTALLAIGNSLLTVRPLTCLSITELSRRNDTEYSDVNLQAGRVRAEVNPPSDAKIEFTVRSSSATASVRGTLFEFQYPLSLCI